MQLICKMDENKKLLNLNSHKKKYNGQIKEGLLIIISRSLIYAKWLRVESSAAVFLFLCLFVCFLEKRENVTWISYTIVFAGYIMPVRVALNFPVVTSPCNLLQIGVGL